MTEPTPIRAAGAAVRGVVAVRLPVKNGAVSTPEPLMEYGGLQRVPTGTVVRLDIGDAQRCFPSDAGKVAGAIQDAAEVEIVGTDWCGVAETRQVLAAALEAARQRPTG